MDFALEYQSRISKSDCKGNSAAYRYCTESEMEKEVYEVQEANSH